MTTDVQKEKSEMSLELRLLKSHTMDTLSCENKALKNEITLLRDENRKLKVGGTSKYRHFYIFITKTGS